MRSISIRALAAKALRPLLVATALVAITLPSRLDAQVQVVSNSDGHTLQVNGEPFFVQGVNWDYFPVGTTTTYSLWAQSDAFIEQALRTEMSLLQAMGANAIRVYDGIPAKWIQHIYEEYGIWSIVNHATGRYGLTLNGTYIPQTDYSDPATREFITNDVVRMVREIQGTPGLLVYLLGNENNYGLEWSSAETENLPAGEGQRVKARYMYSLFGDVVQAIKRVDDDTPIAMANGDLQYLDIIAEEIQGLDIFGSNVYRGISFRDYFEEVERVLGIPTMFTEFGADAFNARTRQEDQMTQARYLVGQWMEIYANAAGKGLVGNSIGGLTFQWTDGWWKVGQTDNLDVHDTFAGWAADAYPEDYVEGANNMNEEWWGIAAKGQTDAGGFYQIYPRAAFYALQDAYELDVYGPGVTLDRIYDHFASINVADAALRARGDLAALRGAESQVAAFTGLRIDLETYNTGGSNISTPESPEPGSPDRPATQGFDTKQSIFGDFQFTPAANVQADVTVNVVGNVPTNPINELFWEAPSQARQVEANGEPFNATFDRVRLYQANVSWEEDLFSLSGFYRTGHYHWAYEGDFFNLYREANYGPNLDIYQGIAPVGVEFEGKLGLSGLRLAFGPELWWGANPAVLASYQRNIMGWAVTATAQEDFQRQGAIVSSFAIPVPEDRKVAIAAEGTVGPFGVQIGGLWAGSKLRGREYQVVDDNGDVLQDVIDDEDTFGGKIKLTTSVAGVQWYGLASAMGLVANGGFDQTQTYTGWTLKDNGSGNQVQLLSGFSYRFGNLEVAPNFMWQQPLVGPVPASADAPGRPRNILDDPFAVRINRETIAGELVLTWDPTPATWMYAWDNDMAEDAPLAVSLGASFWQQKTTADAHVGILADGRTPFAFPAATPAQNQWEGRLRVVSKRSEGVNLILNAFYGRVAALGAAVGNDFAAQSLNRRIERKGATLRAITGPVRFEADARFDDWGPFDYHRDFNLTFPMQLAGDVSFNLSAPSWFNMPGTRFGIRAMYRTLDAFSPRFCPGFTTNPAGTQICDPLAPGDNGSEWEFRTYLQVGM
jgi:hypothetical protein